MLTKTAINAVTIIAVCAAGVFYLNNRSADIPVPAPAPVVEAPVKAAPKVRQSASVLSIPKDPRSGQYHFTGRVNSGSVKFLVDTGASAIALTLNDARKAGIDLNRLQYNVPVSTAGGINYAAAVRLDRVSLGGITLRDVDALVLREGLDISLLGMTWLGQLQEVKATPSALLLRL
ncbi:TIGR02281 family clan AA aspartic protease [Litorimonas sp. WD9-15]|uniref:TIGR02281 family clan AA aspartic protease n=1 Tax=Litorimonas sp. WD9-15 TaxID=3418716 RepID=UPI003CFD71F0